MFAQKTPALLLTMQGRGQLFNGQDPGFEEALRQIHGISINNDCRRQAGAVFLARSALTVNFTKKKMVE